MKRNEMKIKNHKENLAYGIAKDIIENNLLGKIYEIKSNKRAESIHNNIQKVADILVKKLSLRELDKIFASTYKTI